jgi:hypothetical protein
MIRDVHPGSRGQKGTVSRMRIRKTGRACKRKIKKSENSLEESYEILGKRGNPSSKEKRLLL